MDKIPVAVLGATGAVGQRFVQLLADHPWFTISSLTGSERTVGGVYRDVCRWVLDEEIPAGIGEMIVSDTDTSLPARILFSALPTRVARQVEPALAEAGYIVCSNASAFRQEVDVPLVIQRLTVTTWLYSSTSGKIEVGRGCWLPVQIAWRPVW